MGSYSGSSDWDDVPSVTDAQRFSPAPAPAPASPAAKTTRDDAEEPLDLTPGGVAGKPLNLILAFDTTGSMRAFIQNVRQKIEYLVQGLLKLMDIRIGLIGVGDHCDDRFMLQAYPPSSKFEDLKRAIHEIRNTSGGDYPEAFECLFKHLNESPAWASDIPTVLVLITDSVPHGMAGAGDAGCPDGVDARAELAKLMPRLKSFYLVNCGNHEASIRIQKTLVASENYFLQLPNFWRLTNLIMAVCMDEVGQLDYFLGLLEKQRGKERRQEVLSLLHR
ncbi:MAG: VWA domain-containing protein [Planctomycetes bacterium]|nr:VWA domain-containing protein [Planctomycetota bacterium]